MFVIANNITTRDAKVNRMLKQLKAASWSLEQEPANELVQLAKKCVEHGADALEVNLQEHDGRPEAMESVIKILQQVTDRQLCLSTANAETLEAGLRACKRPPMVNYISVEEDRLRDMLPLIGKYGAEMILLVSVPAGPSDAKEMLQKAAILVGAANEAGISNDRILIDPGLIHITNDIGQRHTAEVKEFLKSVPDLFDPPVRSTCWIANISAGAPSRLRPVLESTLLAMLAGAGLSSVFMDVFRRENMRTVRMIRIFDNELIYSEKDVEL